MTTETCNCPQALALQEELATARVRISNLEYQNLNLRARVEAAETAAKVCEERHRPFFAELAAQGALT